MTHPRLIARFQPMAAEGRGGMERVWHHGAPIPLDITPYVLGGTADAVRALHAEASLASGKDLDHVADAIPGFVEANTGKGGFDLLLDDDDIDAFLEAHGLDAAGLTDENLERLRGEYGVEKGAIPFVEGEEPAPAPRAP